MITKYIFRIIKRIPLLRQTIYFFMVTDLQHKTGTALFHLHEWRIKPLQLLAQNQLEGEQVRKPLPTCFCSTKVKDKANATGLNSSIYTASKKILKNNLHSLCGLLKLNLHRNTSADLSFT